MKYKVLLAGGNKTIIDDFFWQMDDVFEAQTSSVRYEDLLSHANYFQPDVFVYCMSMETRDDMSRMVSVKNKFSKRDIPLVIIGEPEECDSFAKTTAGIADFVLEKPITAKKIEQELHKYLKKLEKEKEDERERQRVEEEKKLLDEVAEEMAAAKAEEARRKHILVVDDDARMLKVIKEHLRDSYDVATAINGKLAMKFLENKTTDLILLDFVMPDEDGPAVLKKLHANPATKDIPVIFLTGVTERENIQKALVEKPQGYLLKPIEREKLLSSIQSVLH